MRLNRPQGAATSRASTTGTVRGRLGAGAIRVLSVTAVAAAACSLWAGAASADTSHVKHHTSTTVSASPNPVDVDSAVTFTATVRGWVPTGTVQFLFGTRKLCHASLSHLKAHCTYGGFPDAAVKTITADYLGNSTHAASSGTTKLTVQKPVTTKSATTTTITNANPGTVDAGDAFTIDVTVTSASGTPTGTVTIAPTSPADLPSSYSCSFTLGDAAGCAVTPGAGTFGDIDYKATYSGDSTHNGSVSGTWELIVPETTTTTVTPATATAGSVTLTATVVGQDEGNISPSAGGSGTVTFESGGTAISGCTDVALVYNGGGGNIATCTTTLAAGSYAIAAIYSGDPNNLTSTGTETLVVSAG